MSDGPKLSNKADFLDENDLEIIKDQIFKKPESLKQILNKFSSKTYTIKEEEEIDDNYEVDIKAGICDTFEYIMNMREDFIIDNIVTFFQNSFVEKVYSDTSKDIEKIDFVGYLKTLLPESDLESGGKYNAENTTFKNYTQYENTKSFDTVLQKPFIESLLMGFFFTSSARLQNSILSLIQRCCGEKEKVKDSIDKLELLFSEEHKLLYTKIGKKLNVLKNFVSNAQVIFI